MEINQLKLAFSLTHTDTDKHTRTHTPHRYKVLDEHHGNSVQLSLLELKLERHEGLRELLLTYSLCHFRAA